MKISVEGVLIEMPLRQATGLLLRRSNLGIVPYLCRPELNPAAVRKWVWRYFSWLPTRLWEEFALRHMQPNGEIRRDAEPLARSLYDYVGSDATGYFGSTIEVPVRNRTLAVPGQRYFSWTVLKRFALEDLRWLAASGIHPWVLRSWLREHFMWLPEQAWLRFLASSYLKPNGEFQMPGGYRCFRDLLAYIGPHPVMWVGTPYAEPGFDYFAVEQPLSAEELRFFVESEAMSCDDTAKATTDYTVLLTYNQGFLVDFWQQSDAEVHRQVVRDMATVYGLRAQTPAVVPQQILALLHADGVHDAALRVMKMPSVELECYELVDPSMGLD